ncbi:MAG: pantoate--beta-alanine ligase [Allomuricauda sp.]
MKSTQETWIKILRSWALCLKKIVVFVPSTQEIYDGKIQSKSYDFDGLDKVMEGEFREGHSNGVGTIVELLLRTVAPNRAYFGEKEFLNNCRSSEKW